MCALGEGLIGYCKYTGVSMALKITTISILYYYKYRHSVHHVFKRSSFKYYTRWRKQEVLISMSLL